MTKTWSKASPPWFCTMLVMFSTLSCCFPFNANNFDYFGYFFFFFSKCPPALLTYIYSAKKVFIILALHFAVMRDLEFFSFLCLLTVIQLDR